MDPKLAAIVLIFVFVFVFFSEFAEKHPTAFAILMVLIVLAVIGGIGLFIYLRLGIGEVHAPKPVKGVIDADFSSTSTESLPKEALPRSTLFNKVVKALEEFQPRRSYQSEREYHIALETYLQSELKGEVVKSEQGRGEIVDISVGLNNEVGIEIKILYDKNYLDKIAGQLMRYSGRVGNLILMMFNVGNIPRQEIDEFVTNLKENSKTQDVTVIVK